MGRPTAFWIFLGPRRNFGFCGAFFLGGGFGQDDILRMIKIF